MIIDVVLLSLLLISAIWTVMTVRLIKSVIGLAITSVMVAIVMFRLNSPLAGVFELSVCAGLIPVIFITAVSYTERLTKDKFEVRRHDRFARFRYLFVVLAVIAFALFSVKIIFDFTPVVTGAAKISPQAYLWKMRSADLLGQIIVLLTGAIGVALFFREKQK